MRRDDLIELIEEVANRKIGEAQEFQSYSNRCVKAVDDMVLSSLQKRITYLERKLEQKEIDFGGWDNYSDDLNKRLKDVENLLGAEYCEECQENHFNRLMDIENDIEEIEDSMIFDDIDERLKKVEELTGANKFHYETKKELIPNDGEE